MLLLAVFSLATACGGGETTAAPAEEATAQAVVLWGAEGGFVTATTNTLRPPRVVVYSDGQVIADAVKTFRLTEAEVGETVASMEKFLNGQPPTAAPKPDAPMVTDVPDTVLGVRAKDGRMHEVRVPALDQIADFYPKELTEAKKLMDGLATRAASEGTDYTAARVRVVAENAPGVEGEAKPWPAGVQEPSGSVDPVWKTDLDGAASAAVVKAVPQGGATGPKGGGPGQSLFKTGSGAVFVVSWRYLLPDE
ncbi:hypothetical protein Aph01nite_38790 [Acrocarpospora phusangensis]|uniref:Uncharacterized protein n=2 Tax=Acrocarpospora phusangensis TaxID=1070424 RepID=A0A919QD80_9ACTN|nr:hypothetical protein Aph01nite_38790 [Acrocarpospora phusangensis]